MSNRERVRGARHRSDNYTGCVSGSDSGEDGALESGDDGRGGWRARDAPGALEDAAGVLAGTASGTRDPGATTAS